MLIWEDRLCLLGLLGLQSALPHHAGQPGWTEPTESKDHMLREGAPFSDSLKLAVSFPLLHRWRVVHACLRGTNNNEYGSPRVTAGEVDNNEYSSGRVITGDVAAKQRTVNEGTSQTRGPSEASDAGVATVKHHPEMERLMEGEADDSTPITPTHPRLSGQVPTTQKATFHIWSSHQTQGAVHTQQHKLLSPGTGGSSQN